jgi:hypothetical protein
MPTSHSARLLQATIIGSGWFLVLPLLNVIAGGSLRETIVYANAGHVRSMARAAPGSRVHSRRRVKRLGRRFH